MATGRLGRVIQITRSAADTESVGERLAADLGPGDVVLVSGELGAGKTTLIRGACRALGVTEPVTSPPLSEYGLSLKRVISELHPAAPMTITASAMARGSGTDASKRIPTMAEKSRCIRLRRHGNRYAIQSESGNE